MIRPGVPALSDNAVVEFDGSTAARAIKPGVTLSLLQATGADKRLAADKNYEDGLRAKGFKDSPDAG